MHAREDNMTLHHNYVIWSFGYCTNIVLLWRSSERSFSFLWYSFCLRFFFSLSVDFFAMFSMGIQWKSHCDMVLRMKSSILSFNSIMWDVQQRQQYKNSNSNSLQQWVEKEMWLYNGTRMSSTCYICWQCLPLGVHTTADCDTLNFHSNHEAADGRGKRKRQEIDTSLNQLQFFAHITSIAHLMSHIFFFFFFFIGNCMLSFYNTSFDKDQFSNLNQTCGSYNYFALALRIREMWWLKSKKLVERIVSNYPINI